MTNTVSTIEVWQALFAAVGLLLSGVALVWLIVWRFFVWSDGKTSERFETMSSDIGNLRVESTRLAREFSDLRGEIRTRFALQDQKGLQESIKKVMDATVKSTLEGSHDR